MPRRAHFQKHPLEEQASQDRARVHQKCRDPPKRPGVHQQQLRHASSIHFLQEATSGVHQQRRKMADHIDMRRKRISTATNSTRSSNNCVSSSSDGLTNVKVAVFIDFSLSDGAKSRAVQVIGTDDRRNLDSRFADCSVVASAHSLRVYVTGYIADGVRSDIFTIKLTDPRGTCIDAAHASSSALQESVFHACSSYVGSCPSLVARQNMRHLVLTLRHVCERVRVSSGNARQSPRLERVIKAFNFLGGHVHIHSDFMRGLQSCH